MNRKQYALRVINAIDAFLLRSFRKVRVGKRKKDGSLVSAADHGAERIFLNTVGNKFPDDGVLSEESVEKKSRNGFRWILDPLDGTHNFLAGLPCFGVLLALEHDGEIIFSVCSFPSLRERYIAEKGKGATCNSKKIHVSSQSALPGAVFCADGNFRRFPQRILSDLKAFSRRGCRIRIFGSGPYGLTQVASGHAAVARLYSGCAWDIAAPALLVEEAGGKVTNELDEKWSLSSSRLSATNGRVHKEVILL